MTKIVGKEVEYASGDLLAGKYRVDRRLGSGAMGVVYEVTQTDLERKCAIKVMRGSLARDAELVARFRAEAQTHSLLEGSGHICTVFDYGTLDDGTPFYAMTLLRGRPLSELIHYYHVTTRRPFPTRTALAIAHQICKALAFAHERGIVHRDIKPENLFVHVMGSTWWVLVVDFGIAHHEAIGESDDMFIGTPPYSPPEEVLGHPPSPKMDIHAAGVVLFKMLTGQSPFAHLGAHDLAAMLSAKPPAAPPLSDFGSFPRELTALVARCLSHHPDERPDARHLAARFLDLAAGAAPPDPAAHRESDADAGGGGGGGGGAKHPHALTAPVTPAETPMAISRWQQDQDKWDRTQRTVRRRERLRRLAKQGALALALAVAAAGAFSTGVLLFRKPASPPEASAMPPAPSPSPPASAAARARGQNDAQNGTVATPALVVPAHAPSSAPALSASQRPSSKTAPRARPEPSSQPPVQKDDGPRNDGEARGASDLEPSVD